jgi:light-harvesting complex 1 beta chain
MAVWKTPKSPGLAGGPAKPAEQKTANQAAPVGGPSKPAEQKTPNQAGHVGGSAKSTGQKTANLSGLTDAQAREFHEHWKHGVWSWVMIAAAVHLVTWAYQPWF